MCFNVFTSKYICVNCNEIKVKRIENDLLKNAGKQFVLTTIYRL